MLSAIPYPKVPLSMSSLSRHKPKRRSYYPNDDCVRECPQEELLNAYKDWEPEVERFLIVSFQSEPLRNFSARFELTVHRETDALDYPPSQPVSVLCLREDRTRG